MQYRHVQVKDLKIKKLLCAVLTAALLTGEVTSPLSAFAAEDAAEEETLSMDEAEESEDDADLVREADKVPPRLGVAEQQEESAPEDAEEAEEACEEEAEEEEYSGIEAAEAGEECSDEAEEAAEETSGEEEEEASEDELQEEDAGFFNEYSDADVYVNRIIELSDAEAGAYLERWEEQRDDTGIAADRDASGFNEYDSSTAYFYNQLNSYEKTLWDGLKAECEDFYYGSAEPAEVGTESDTGCKRYGFGHVSYDNTKIGKDSRERVIFVFLRSNPKYFFLKDAIYKNDWIGFSVSWECRSRARINSYRDEIESITAEWMPKINAVKEPLDKENLIIELICDHVIEYGWIPSLDDKGAQRKNTSGEVVRDYGNQTIAGALCDRKCVCTGYAMATTYFCNMAGVDTVTIFSDKKEEYNKETGKKEWKYYHAYNYVLLYGNWYCQDTCWMECFCRSEFKNKGKTGEKKSDYIDWNSYLHNKSQATFGGDGKSESTTYAHRPQDVYASWDITLPDRENDIVTDAGRKVKLSYQSGSGPAFKTQEYIWGMPSERPEIPENSGYRFGGFYEDASYAAPFVFGDYLYKDLQLYARWTQIVRGDEYFIIEDGVLTAYTGNGGAITIPADVRSIDANSFLNKNAGTYKTVTSISVAKGNNDLTAVDGVLFSKDKKKLIAYPRGSKNSSYTVPAGTEEIGDYAIMYTGALKELSLPEGLKRIGTWGILNDGSLKKLVIPSTVSYIGSWALAYNGSAEGALVLPDGLTNLGAAAFNGDSKLTSIVLGTGITTINERTFENCSAVTKVTIPAGVKEIKKNAFSGMTALAEICFTGSREQWEAVEKPEAGIPAGCKISFESTAVYTVSFEGSDITPQSVKAGETAVRPEDPVKNGYDFGGWYTDENYTEAYDFSAPVKSDIRLYALWKEKQEFTIVNGKLTAYGGEGGDITIPVSVTAIDVYGMVRGNKFTSVSVAEGNSSFCSVDGVLFTADKKTLVYYPNCREGEYSIPAGTEKIGAYAFIYNKNLTKLVFPEGIKQIGAYAVFNCAKINSIKLPDSLISIGDGAFGSTFSLSDDITIPSGTTGLGKALFKNDNKIKNVYVQSAVDAIGSEMFYGCSALESVTLHGTLLSIDKDAFAGCTSLASISFGGSKQQWDTVLKNEAAIPENCTVNCKDSAESDALPEGIVIVVPSKTEYVLGEELDLTGGKVELYYQEGRIVTITLTADMVSGYDNTKTGTQQLTIKYQNTRAVYSVYVKAEEKAQDASEGISIGAGGQYPTLKEAFAAIQKEQKNGSTAKEYVFEIGSVLDEQKAVSTPRGDFTIKITGGELRLKSPTITANCNLILDCKVSSSVSKKPSVKVTAGRRVTIKKDLAAAGTISGTKSSELILEGSVKTETLKNFALVDVSKDKLLTVSKKLSGVSLFNGRLNTGGSTDISDVGDATVYVWKDNAKKTAVKNVNGKLTIIYENGAAVPGGTQILKVTGKAFDGANVYVSNKDSEGRQMNAFLYGNKLKAENAEALSLWRWDVPEEGGAEKWISMGYYRNLDCAYAAMADKTKQYFIYVNQDITVEKLTLPALNKGQLYITGSKGVKEIDCGSTKTVSPGCYTSFDSVHLSSGGKNVKINAKNNGVSLKNTTVDGVSTSGWFTVKGNVTVNGSVKAYGIVSNADESLLCSRQLNVGYGGVYYKGKSLILELRDSNGNPLRYAAGDTIKAVKSFKGDIFAKDDQGNKGDKLLFLSSANGDSLSIEKNGNKLKAVK